MTAETREIARHLRVCWGTEYAPTRLEPDDSAVTRHAHEPMPADERARWDRDRIERHIARLRGNA